VDKQIDKPKALAAASLIGAVGGLSFNLLPLINSVWIAERHLTEDQVGVIASYSLAGFSLGILSAPFWIRRVRWRRAIAAGLVAMVAASLLTPFMLRPLDWPVVFVLSGTASALYYAPVVTALGDAQDPDRAYGIMYAAQMALAIVLSVVYANWLIPTWGLFGAMFALAATGLVALAALSPIPDNSAPLSVPAMEERSLARFVLSAVLAGTLIVTLGAVGIWAFLEQLAMDRGVSSELIGFLVTVSLIASLIGSGAAAFLGDRWGKTTPLVISLGMMLVGTFFMGLPQSNWAFTSGLILMSYAWLFGLAYTTALLAVSDISGRFVSLSPASFGLGAAIGPVFYGSVITQQGYVPFLIYSAATVTFGFVLVVIASVTLSRAIVKPA